MEDAAKKNLINQKAITSWKPIISVWNSFWTIGIMFVHIFRLENLQKWSLFLKPPNP